MGFSVGFRRFWIALAFAVIALALGWLVVGEGSPLSSFFLHHVDLPNLWLFLNFPAAAVCIFFSSNAHQPDGVACYIAAFAQWFSIGYVFAIWSTQPHQPEATTK